MYGVECKVSSVRCEVWSELVSAECGVSSVKCRPCKNRNRRKLRSQTSENMDRWKSRGGKSQRGEEKKWEDQRRGQVGRKKCRCAKRPGSPNAFLQ